MGLLFCIINKLSQHHEAIPHAPQILRKYLETHSAKYFTKSHEWIEYLPEKKVARVGITDYAQQQLGEITHFELPSVNKFLEANDSAAVVESVKIAGDIYTPVKGKITGVNKDLESNPQLVNDDANKTWIFEVTYDKEAIGLLTEAEYHKIVA